MFTEITFPIDTTEQEDFSQWSVQVNGVDGLDNTFHTSVHYSTDPTLLADCFDFPSGVTSGYTECYNGDPYIRADYSPAFSGATIGYDNNFSINKSNSLTVGTTYYAQSVVEVDGSFVPLVSSDVISFTVGVPGSGTGGIPGGEADCSWYNMLCWGKQLLSWAFLPSDASLHQFTTLTLEDSLPFSYVYDVGNLFDELFANGGSMEYAVSASTPLGEIDFISASQISAVPYASTIKTILGYMLYFFTAMTLYRIITRIFNSSSV